MRKDAMTDLRKMLKRTVLPEKFSYPKKPITLTVLVATTERLAGEIQRYTELAGIVPFDWYQDGSAPRALQARMNPGDRFRGLYFGFDTMLEALAAKAKCLAISNCLDALVMTAAQEREALRHCLEQMERETGDRPTVSSLDGGDEVYWRDHPDFHSAA